MVLVLVQPLVAVIGEQLVLAEGGIDEAVDEGGGQVHAGRIHLGATAAKPWDRHTQTHIKLNRDSPQYTLFPSVSHALIEH